MKSLKEILLVEDDLLFQFISRSFIEKYGFAENVVCKPNGLEALSYLKDTCLLGDELDLNHCSDLILLDLNMPIMNGFDFLQNLKDLNAESLIRSKVVVLSSSSDPGDWKLAKSFGVKGYVQKPLTLEKLQSVLQLALLPLLGFLGNV